MSTARVVRFVYVACQVDERRIGIDLERIERVIRAVEITPLRSVPPSILGVISYHGALSPVLNARRYLKLPDRDVRPEDKIVLSQSSRGRIGVLVDDVTDVVEASELDVQVAGPAPALTANTVLRLKDGLVYVRSLTSLLTEEELNSLTRALGQAR